MSESQNSACPSPTEKLGTSDITASQSQWQAMVWTQITHPLHNL